MLGEYYVSFYSGCDMCGRFALTDDRSSLAKEFGISIADATTFSPRFNIAPSQPIAVIVNRNGVRKLEFFVWGLVPSWAKDSSIGTKLINARAETLSTKPSFKSSFRKRRCLIIASGFYEWARRDKTKVPHYIHIRTKKLFTFASLWDEWVNPQNKMIKSCTIITTAPNEVIRPLHNRMPVIISEEHRKTWLDPSCSDTNLLQSYLKPYQDSSMEAYPVSKIVNSPRNDMPECICPK